jgi:hypothetical protein
MVEIACKFGKMEKDYVDEGHDLADKILEYEEFKKVERIAEMTPNEREQRYIDYFNEFNKYRLNPNDNFHNPDLRKQLMIKHFNYKNLTGEKSKSCKYKECTPEKICMASNNLYKTAERINKQYRN